MTWHIYIQKGINEAGHLQNKTKKMDQINNLMNPIVLQ